MLVLLTFLRGEEEGSTMLVFGPPKNEEEDPSLRSTRCRAEIIVQSSKEA